jgi:alanyl-tRNA synthetase
MGGSVPEITAQKNLVMNVIKEEENSFLRTLDQGLQLLENVISGTQGKLVSGQKAFELYDTFGFPIDLTALILRERGYDLDEAGFDKAMLEQKTRSRAASEVSTEDWVIIEEGNNETFVGYDQVENEVKITRFRKTDSKKDGVLFQLVLNNTPFYPEGGGQVGDKGLIQHSAESIRIFDTKKENNLIIHLCEQLPTELTAEFEAIIDLDTQEQTAKNHSATHLLHHALRTILGTHVEQKGSLVNSTNLRFDFSHFSKVSDEEMEQIEGLVHAEIAKNIRLDEHRSMLIDDAKALGAMALFGEKYGDHVRVIKFGDSVELCGGIHVTDTAKIGLFKIVSESAVAAGVRRIEAITGKAAEAYFKEKATTLSQVQSALKNPKDIVKSVEDLLTKNQQLQKEIEVLVREKAGRLKTELKSRMETIGGLSFLGGIVELDANSVKDILFQLKQEFPNFVAIIGNKDSDKCGLNLYIAENLVESNQWNASQWIREVSTHIQGGGGGQAFFATAGGKRSEGLQTAIDLIKAKIA